MRLYSFRTLSLLVGLICLANHAFAQMTVATDGKVGVGTDTPSAKLEVSGDVKVIDTNTAKLGIGRLIGSWRNDFDVLGIGYTSSIWGKRSAIEMNLSSNAIHDGAWKYMQNGHAVNVNLRGDGGFWVSTSESGSAGGAISWKYPFKISHDGLITGGGVPSAMSNGIADGVAFDTDGAVNFGRHQNNNSPFMRYYGGAGLVGTFSAASKDLTLMSTQGDMILGANGTKRLYVKANGWTGINRAIPNAALDVGGNIAVNGAVTHHSDRRFKKEIQSLSHSLETIKHLRGVSYKWRTDDFPENGWEDKKQLGFIAQEIEQVLPELVNTAKDGYKSVSYSQVIPVLVEATKQLSSKVDSLEQDRASLIQQNKNLQAMLVQQQKATLRRLAALEELAKGNDKINVSQKN